MTCILPGGVAQFYAPAAGAITSGLRGWYQFAGNYNDSSGNSNNGTAGGTPTITASGGPNAKYPGYVTTDGTSSYVDLGAPASLELYTTFSILCWVKTSQSGTGFAVAKDYSTGSRGYGIGTSGTQEYVEIQGNAYAQNAGSTVVDGTWHHICATFNSGTVTAYANGTSFALGNPSYGAFTANSLAHWYIGGRAYVGFFNGIAGSFSDVRIYNRVLTATEVSKIYAGTG